MTTLMRNIAKLMLCIPALLLSALPAEALYIGALPPDCGKCGKQGPSNRAPGGSAISLSEGNLTDDYHAAITVKSAFGPTLDFILSYNSMAADGSQARIATVLGYGWTHAYNILLFSQLGHMFRMDGEGHITKYKLGPGGTYTVTPGYFETLVKNPNGSFTLRQRDGTTYDFATVAGTPFLIVGPVYRLTKITDRNGNITALTYNAGKLTTITDTYGRQLTLGYTGNNLTSVTDPLNRVTRFTFDASGTLLTQITDPEGYSVQYRYNELAQITQKIDKDGRVFSYSYANGKPVAIIDGAGNPRFTLSNPNNWATDGAAVATEQLRIYQPSTTTKTDGRGNPWRYDYDKNGVLTRIVAPDNATSLFAYDPVTLQVASMTDANGHSVAFQYDALGNVMRRTDALGNVSSYAYEPTFSMMTSMTDANGRITTYQYDAYGNRTQETDPLGATRQWTYDSHGNVLSERDKNGNVTSYQYDAFGNRVRITDAVGNVTTLAYDAVGNATSRTNARGFTTSYRYDGLNRRTGEIDALSHTNQYVYDGQGNRIQFIDRNGNATLYRYDLRLRLVQVVDALNQAATNTYDGNDNRIAATDRNGHTMTFGYDPQNRLDQVVDALGNTGRRTYDGVGNTLTDSDANGHTTAYQYDALNRLTQKTDAQGFVVTLGYDMTGTAICGACTGPTSGSKLVTKQTDGNGKVLYNTYDGLDRRVNQIRKQGGTAFAIGPNDAITTYGYDGNDNVLAIVEPNGNATHFEFDAVNRRTKLTNAAGDVTLTSYDANSNLQTVTAPNRNVSTRIFDAIDRLIAVADSAGPLLSYSYDAVGNVLTELDGNGNGVSNAYDADYRLTAVTDALGKTKHYDYDAVGNILRATDRAGRVLRYAYDAINRRSSLIDVLGNATTYAYDGVGNLTAVAFADAIHPGRVETTGYGYDNINRVVSETYPDANTRVFAYDAVNLVQRTDQKAQVTRYTYSDLYFLLQRSYTSALASPADNMTYDLSGRMLTAERGGWLVTFAYDGANRVTATTENTKTVGYVYDIPGRKRTLTYPGGRVITESTDARSRLAAIDDAFSPAPIASYSYDPGNRVLMRGYRNTTSAAYTYNANNWLTNLDRSKGVVRIAGFSHGYDDEGNKAFEQKLNDTAGSQNRSEAYQYDALYRLVNYKVGTLVGSTVPVPVTQTQYNLDGLGNWDVKIRDSTIESRTHNLVNELTGIDTLPAATHETLSYDANGNVTEDGRYRYAYDEENRLSMVTRKSDAVVVGSYAYDALSRRVMKIASPAGAPNITGYIYDNARIIEEQSGVGVTQATYVYGNGIDEVLTMDRGGQAYFFHHNSLGSVEAVTDSAGNVVERYGYDAYGAPTVFTAAGVPIPPSAWGTAQSAIGNPWLFTGRQWDDESGIYSYRARYYDAVKGRFLQRDPMGYLVSMNLYEYARSNPPRFVDPYGLWDWDFATIGAIVGTVAAAAVVVVTAPVSVPIAVGAVVAGTIVGGAAAGAFARNEEEAVLIGGGAGAVAAVAVVYAPALIPPATAGASSPQGQQAINNASQNLQRAQSIAASNPVQTIAQDCSRGTCSQPWYLWRQIYDINWFKSAYGQEKFPTFTRCEHALQASHLQRMGTYTLQQYNQLMTKFGFDPLTQGELDAWRAYFDRATSSLP
jgi:RHS repeat-associated protein